MRLVLTVAIAAALAPVAAPAQDLDPNAGALAWSQTLARWTFEKGVEGWKADNDCSVSADAGVLKVTMTGPDPHLHVRLATPLPGPAGVRLRMRSAATGPAQVFWASTSRDHFNAADHVTIHSSADNQWHDYSVQLPVRGSLTGLRIDPATAAGTAEIDSVEIVALLPALPRSLAFERFRSSEAGVEAVLRNRSDQPVELKAAGQAVTIAPGQTAPLTVPARKQTAFETVQVVIEPKDHPPVRRSAVIYHPAGKADWITLRSEALTVKVASDGSGALVERGGKLAAVIAPLAARDGLGVALTAGKKTAQSVEFSQGELKLALSLSGDEIAFALQSPDVVEGPALRPVGPLEQGLMAGLEYLGKGESSSSTLDIETPEHFRFAPDPLKMTMPLMAVVTGEASAAMLWPDTSLQPTYACPNFVDGAYGEHRMSLRGRRIDALVRVSGGRVEDAVAWFLSKVQLPDLPTPPRDSKANIALALRALNGPIKGPGGWGHCAEPSWPRKPFADIASTIWRLTGEVPVAGEFTPGGAHIRNEAVYFVTGRAQQWLDMHRRDAENLRKSQQADGSFRYSGGFRKGHYEDTSSGWCGLPAARLLDFAALTGDKPALEAALKTLEYCKRFDVPRGAQTWELSLHTPDILASAHLVRAYVRGYELTGKDEYLKEARRWALSGVPFVYLWGKYPVMPYATIAVYGATHFKAPLWIGLPVQWCGGVYAYDLLLLARYDSSVNWKQIAQGICLSAQQQIYPEGPLAGTLPDSFTLASQRRNGPNINPCGILSLQLALEGRLDGLDLASNAKHRVVSPYPVLLRDDRAHVDAVEGRKYQILVDGKVVDVTSKGKDVIPLE